MKDREYKDAWQKLKERKIRRFISKWKDVVNTENYPMYDENKSELIEMDKLDGTNEFSNLISDMGDK